MTQEGRLPGMPLGAASPTLIQTVRLPPDGSRTRTIRLIIAG